MPLKVLYEAEGHVVTLEMKTGVLYRGRLIRVEDSMNCLLKDITVTRKDGAVSTLPEVYVRGSQIQFIVLPDMLQNAPFFDKVARLT